VGHHYTKINRAGYVYYVPSFQNLCMLGTIDHWKLNGERERVCIISLSISPLDNLKPIALHGGQSHSLTLQSVRGVSDK